MKRSFFFMLFFIVTASAFSQADAGKDQVICSLGGSVTIGNMTEDPNYCYSWTATPADPGIVNAKTPKITISPSKTTVYTLTVVGTDFATKSSDDVKVTVIDASKTVVDFIENASQNFGFDKIAGDNEIYISLDKNGTTKVDVKVTPFTVDAYCVTSSDPSKFTVLNDSVLLTAETTTIELTGKNGGGNHESLLLEVRCGTKTGDILKTFHVELYKKLQVAKISYYRIKDGTVAATTPSKNPTLVELKTELNKVYKQAVIEVLDVDGSREKDLRYDLNNNGYLDYYNDGANQEKDVIIGAGLTGDPKIAYVEKMRDNWRLAAEAKAGEKKVKMVTVNGLTTTSYRLGSATGAPEVVTVTAIDAATNTLTLQNALTSDHPVTHTVYQGLAGLSSDPQLVTDAGGELTQTIVHEVLHRAVFGNLHDVGEKDNVMYWTTGSTDKKLRYRDQTVVDTGSGAPTGAKQKQWDTILR